MLTNKERQWLKRRAAWYEKRDAYGNKCFGPTCRNCSSYRHFEGGVPYCQEDEDAWVYDYPAQCWLISSKELILEAARFEARVAAKLAITGDVWDFEDMPCRGERQYMISRCPLRKNHWDCADCYIKAARLKVEEAMDG